MTWAQAKFDELQHKNSVLVDALKDARSQLRNFSFNVQVSLHNLSFLALQTTSYP